MLFFWPLVLFWTHLVSGTLLELMSPDGNSPIYTNQFGVDASRCNSIVFQLKSCFGAHMLLGDGTKPGSYEAAIGVNENKETHWRPCSICTDNPLKMCPSLDILQCDSFRPFWLSWKDNQLSFGLGNTPGVNIICNTPNTGLHEIQVLGFLGWTNLPMVFRLGDDTRSRFEVMSNDAVFSDIPMFETENSFANCTRLCHYHDNCGIFSYNEHQGACKLFNRMTSSFQLTPATGWQSWKMKYC